MSEPDGDTTIFLTDEGLPPGEFRDSAPVFDGDVDTPSCRITVSSVLDEVLLELGVPERTRVRIWANHPREPDFIAIVVGEKEARFQLRSIVPKEDRA
jgi:hypothetical protein